MSVGKIANTIYGPHLVNPDRVIVPSPCPRKTVPGPKPFDAPPGVVPYHRYLEAQNRIDRLGDEGALRSPVCRPCDRVDLSPAARLLPPLGEVLPVTPIETAPVEIEQTRQAHAPATGRLLDIYL
ncbi:MAG: hypothetical protein WD114_00725 [Phycisphaerales bacterium]